MLSFNKVFNCLSVCSGNESSAIFLIHMTAIFLIHMTAKWLLLDLLVEETRKKYETPTLARKCEDTKVVI